MAKQHGENFMQSCGASGDVLVVCPTGSTLYNLTTKISDEDWFGMYAVSLRDIMMFEHKPKLKLKDESSDTMFTELEHGCSLILGCKTKVMETLFADHLGEDKLYESPQWKLLKAQRNKFLTKSMASEYVGFIKGQLRDLRTMKPDTDENAYKMRKKHCHIHRLAFECKRVLNGEQPLVKFGDGAERDFLLQIKSGEIPLETIKPQTDDLCKQLDEAVANCNLPVVGEWHHQWVTWWLFKIRQGQAERWLAEGLPEPVWKGPQMYLPEDESGGKKSKKNNKGAKQAVD
eukprot:TRINITY_DN51619_c0_g1_i1.p1 TRINITY_DN51619_c0_g1~~TRINITY_DN51619_c0_g1_i1.p1  ORF type:complete len:288 (+),score=22.40 TRINITY_DN51619_c0_g1_i1:39-902(+)